MPLGKVMSSINHFPSTPLMNLHSPSKNKTLKNKKNYPTLSKHQSILMNTPKIIHSPPKMGPSSPVPFIIPTPPYSTKDKEKTNIQYLHPMTTLSPFKTSKIPTTSSIIRSLRRIPNKLVKMISQESLMS